MCTALSAFLHIPKLDCETSSFGGEFRDIIEAIKIPGCDQLQIHGIDPPELVQNRSSPAYKQFLQLTKRFQTLDGIIVNSIMEMEEGPVKAFRENRTNQSIHLVGPITQTNSKNEERGFECVKWLEKQPEKSVLYVSFGGGGALSQDQTNELAFGLEQSGKRFLWGMRAPSNSANVGLSSTNEDPLRFLPEGFLERTKERGLVVPSWAPQVQILSHGSIGEQRLNAVMLSNGLKVALWPKMNENGIVVNEEISKVVMSLMEGEEGKEIYKRMRCLKDFVTNSWNNGGSSTMALDEVTSKWRNFNRN
ncbi:hydroquinone glucosyltransferase-like [Senna tora]|uniref:Hydroquinone glucosyltransferase-like n=1 Tax=Senna tora TaxID=362788 RepID=A0A834X069_9FABA|nr:hydroquinone glucosyltransferase-like [Senna tora]